MSADDHAKMSPFSRRNSTSALSYFSSKPDPMVTCLELSPLTRSICLVSTEALKVFFVRQLISVEEGFREGGIAAFALFRLLEVAIDGDNTIGSRHLQLAVDVTRSCHELGEGGASKDSMIIFL